jgi:hypothetical protein
MVRGLVCCNGVLAGDALTTARPDVGTRDLGKMSPQELGANQPSAVDFDPDAPHIASRFMAVVSRSSKGVWSVRIEFEPFLRAHSLSY